MTTTVPAGAALYLRVSTEEQVSNLSLDVQEQGCRAACEREGWPVVAVFREEGASAKTLERPELQRLLAAAGRPGSKIGRIVVYRLDRLSRSQQDFYVLRHTLARHGVQLVSASEKIDEQSIEAVIVETFSVLQAQIDNMIRSSRARAGMTEAARRGRWVWQAPVGYRMQPRGVDDRSPGLEPDPERAPFVRRAFELVAAGLSVRSAHQRLAGEGFSLDGRRPIRYEAFRRMLRHPLYCGRLECDALGVAASSAAPALIDEATWMRAQRAIAHAGGEPYRRKPEASADFPLRGVVRCPCGRRLVAYRARGKSGRRWPYYRCLGCNRNLPAAAVERAWEGLLSRMAIAPELVDLIDRAISRKLETRAAELETRLARARQKLGLAESRLERLVELRIDGEITPEEYATARGRVTAERDAARLELANLTDPAPSAERASAWMRRALTDPVRLWIELSPAARAAFAARVFYDGVKLSPDGELSNPAKSLMLLPLVPLPAADPPMVGPECASANPADEPVGRILSWVGSWRDTEAACLGVAA